MTYNELWQRLTSIYDEGEAKAIARMVLDVRFNMSMTDIICGKVTQLSGEDTVSLQKIVTRLEQAEPVQYVLGTSDFYGRTFHVEPGVLIPRPETEELCRWIVSVNNHIADILDVGCGSGCISVTLALDIPQANVTAWDISPIATRVTAGNAMTMNAKVSVLKQDALNPPVDNEKWDVIVSNPPYICEQERETMARNVLDYEPDMALFVPDEYPLRFYRAIAEYAVNALRHGGSLFFEINPIYAEQVLEMLAGLGFKQTEIREDQFGKQRFTKSTRS